MKNYKRQLDGWHTKKKESKNIIQLNESARRLFTEVSDHVIKLDKIRIQSVAFNIKQKKHPP